MAHSGDKKSVNRKRKLEDADAVSSDFVPGYSTLEYINDDCLHYIFTYLDFLDTMNLAATCSRFHNFVKAFIYPKKTKKICIADSSTGFIATVSALDANPSQQIKLRSFETLFSFFGEFVDDLTFSCMPLPNSYQSEEKLEIWRNFMAIMKKCKNLTKLRLKYYTLRQRETHELQRNLIERSQNIKELEFYKCSGLTSNWLAKLNIGVSKVDKLSLSTSNPIGGNFFDYFKNMSSLSIWFTTNSYWKNDEIAMIFDKNSHCLKNLKLSNLTRSNDYRSVVSFIFDKLHKLENLGLGIELTHTSESLIDLPYLRSLVMWSDINVNSVLRKLSVNGIIEELTISKGEKKKMKKHRR